jgi:hypothetical protein
MALTAGEEKTQMEANQKKILSTIFKSLHKVTTPPKDYRRNLERVSVTRHEGMRVQFEATDGHRAVRLTVPQSLVGDVAAGKYDAKRCAALLAAGAEIAPEPDDGMSWPDFAQVIPQKSDGGAIAHYNATLLSETVTVVSELLVAGGCDKKKPAVRVQLGENELYPARLDGVGKCDAEVVAVLMPWRV